MTLRVITWHSRIQADSSVHKLIAFKNRTYFSTLTLFSFFTNKKQYLDTLHMQKKRKKKTPSDAQ